MILPQNKILKQSLFLIILLVPVLFFCGCSGGGIDEDTKDKVTEEKKQEQEEEYQRMKNILPGTWEAYEHYKLGEGWRPISEISWSTKGYTFNADGTYIEHHSDKNYEGTYRLEKNPDYIKYSGVYYSKLLLFLKYKNSSEIQHVIWLDEGYLRLHTNSLGSTVIPSNAEGGEASIRYKRK